MHRSNWSSGIVYVLLMFACLGCSADVKAQFNEIHFASQPTEGRLITIEMYWRSACPSFGFTSELYDIQISGSQIQATVDTATQSDSGGVCPPIQDGWQPFQFGPLPVGDYDLTIFNVNSHDGGPPVGPDIYATVSFSVLAAPNQVGAHVIPALSPNKWFFLMGVLALTALVSLRRR